MDVGAKLLCQTDFSKDWSEGHFLGSLKMCGWSTYPTAAYFIGFVFVLWNQTNTKDRAGKFAFYDKNICIDPTEEETVNFGASVWFPRSISNQEFLYDLIFDI